MHYIAWVYNIPMDFGRRGGGATILFSICTTSLIIFFLEENIMVCDALAITQSSSIGELIAGCSGVFYFDSKQWNSRCSLNIVFFPGILDNLPPLPRQHSAANGRTKNYQPLGVTVHSQYVESFEGLLQRCRLQWIVKKHNFSWTPCTLFTWHEWCICENDLERFYVAGGS